MNQKQTTIADAPNGHADEPTVLYEDPHLIRRSPFNRTIEQADLGELVDSVRSHGVIQPLIVRTTQTGWELIAGERRLKAALTAKLPKVPFIVRRNASDREVIELQTIENDQREDLPAMQRAEKYQQLLEQYEKDGMKREKAIEHLAERVGRKRSTVYEVLTLLKLPGLAREAINDGRLPQSHAALVAKVENPELQERLVRVIAPKNAGSRETDALEDEMGIWGGERNEKGTLPFRATKELVEEQAQLFAAKKNWEEVASKARKAGQTVLSYKETGRNQGFVQGSDWCYDFDDTGTYKALMGKHAPRPILTCDARFKPIEVYQKADANAAAKKNGKIWSRGGLPKERQERREKADKAEQMKPVAKEAREFLVQAARRNKPKFPWKFLIEWIDEKSYAPHIQKVKAKDLIDRKIGGILVEILVAHPDELYSDGRWDPSFAGLCKHYGVDLKKLEKQMSSPSPSPDAKVVKNGKNPRKKGNKK